MSGRIAAHRRRARRRSPHRLRRRGQRRRLEVGQRRHHLQAGVRQAAGAVDRRRSPSIRRIRRPSGSAPAKSWTRNCVSVGDGIYKSTDGGDNWTNMGLPESERIAKILVDPTDTNTVYACVPGKLWSDSDERGVYKTTDGGKTWTKVLKGANASTGCSMMSMDRAESEDALRRHVGLPPQGLDLPLRRRRSRRAERQRPVQVDRRRRDLESSSTTSRRNGLPAKPWGRVAVTVAPSKPNVVYAFIEAEPPKNGAVSLRRRRQDLAGARPQPDDGLASVLLRQPDRRSEEREQASTSPTGGSSSANDGGKSFSGIGGGAHGDFHDVWIDPKNTDHLIAGDDGGLWYSYDGGNRWWKADNLPVSQFYHVSVDMDRSVPRLRRPAGQQLVGRRLAVSRRHHQRRWENMYGGDGFWMFADPTDPDYIYAEAQGGEIGRVNRKTHETRGIKPLPHYKEGSCASTGTRRSTSVPTTRARSTSARSSCSARATTARPGSASRPT